MKRLTRSVVFLLVSILLVFTGAGCSSLALHPTPTAAPSPTPALPPADEIAFAFFQGWEQQDYEAMYSLLSPSAQERISEDQFIATYVQVAEEAGLLGVKPQVLAAYQPDAHAEVSFSVNFQTEIKLGKI